jgi:hypothetical protein
MRRSIPVFADPNSAPGLLQVGRHVPGSLYRIPGLRAGSKKNIMILEAWITAPDLPIFHKKNIYDPDYFYSKNSLNHNPESFIYLSRVSKST